ncbi:MAG: hypothetical protein HYR67_16735 [Bacteroidetes bacterium]|nr:hypothetical protein [Bacteroidota bacterium]
MSNIKTEDLIALRPSLVYAMIKACKDRDSNLLRPIFSELGEGWRLAVLSNEMNDFFWNYGNAIIRLYNNFKDEAIDNLLIEVPKYENDGSDEQITIKFLFDDVQITYADLRG